MAMKKGGKKEIIYVVSNSNVFWIFYLEGVAQHKCGGGEQHTDYDSVPCEPLWTFVERTGQEHVNFGRGYVPPTVVLSSFEYYKLRLSSFFRCTKAKVS